MNTIKLFSLFDERFINFICTFFSFPGFSRLRMHNKEGLPVAFVEFQVSSMFSSPRLYTVVCLINLARDEHLELYRCENMVMVKKLCVK